MLMTAISAIVVFGFIVLFHEWGHFITAKMTGMRVDEFAIGFGPRICGWTSGETKYSLRAIPLGGFNRIAGMTKEEDEDPEYEYGPAYERAYYRRPIWCRMIVIVAGGVMNIITPILLFWGVYFCTGINEPSPEPVIGMTVEGMPAHEAGIMPGDRVLAIDGKPVAVWSDISAAIANSPVAHDVTIQREGTEKVVTLTPVEKDGRMLVGVTGTIETRPAGFFESLGVSVEHTVFILGRMISSLGGMFTGSTPASEIPGPIGVLQMTGEVAQQGILPLLNFAALLSLNLGIVNLLPVPVLDGGHFVALCLEALRGKPLSEKVNNAVQTFGLALLLGLMVYATFNDITR